MLRLPSFTYYTTTTLTDAIAIKEQAGADGMYVAGGTDLYPNMKRRHQEPRIVIALGDIDDLRGLEFGDRPSIGAGLTLTDLTDNPALQGKYPAVAKAAALVSTPLLRNMGTLGGNLCLDTRCNYYNQTYEWRKAIDFCMKKDGVVCWVAPRSPRCWAVQSSDIAPVMVAIGADYVLVGPSGERVLPAHRFYHDDGIEYLTKQPSEILTRVVLPATNGWDATYWKLRRRGSFDFPVLGVAVRIDWTPDDTVRAATIVISAVSSYPRVLTDAADDIVGSQLDDETIERAATTAYRPSKPMDNTDYGLSWRKEMTRQYVKGALRELRDRRLGA